VVVDAMRSFHWHLAALKLTSWSPFWVAPLCVGPQVRLQLLGSGWALFLITFLGAGLLTAACVTLKHYPESLTVRQGVSLLTSVVSIDRR
jgi:hypothetical protein